MKYLSILLLLLPQLIYSQSELPLNLDGLKWRNIGPANQGGRVVDIEALDNQFRKVWVATGSGGIWYSENAGTTWTPIFDKYETASIGDIAIYQEDPNIIWVGTGEANNRNSVSWGNGVYRSTDGGKSFENVGLQNTHQIARVLTIPGQPESACACAIGHLWGTSGERGLFKTEDGGKSWQKLTNGLPDDGKTGCNDLVMDPTNPDIMYASFYERLRKPWTFQSGGENGGIFKTTDGGKTWEKLETGLPSGPTGRIGLAIYRNDPSILMALVEAERSDDLNRPGSGVYRSENGGESWEYVNTYNNRPFYYSQIRINPTNDQRVYILTTRFMVSEDGGKTLKNGSSDEEIHGDFHAMWLDPTDTDRYYIGADKGFSLTHDHGKKFQLMDNLSIAQFYRISFDYRDPYYVYGGLQDNGFYAISSFSRDIRGILNDSNWKVHWGDGQYSHVDKDDWRLMYTSSENGSLNKYDPLTHRIERIAPRQSTISNLAEYYSADEIRESNPFRYNWSAPMKVGASGDIYLGGNHIFKSSDQGQSWRIISPDISSNDSIKTIQGQSGGITPDNTGAESHCTASTLAVSALNEYLIWVGTDDGQVHVTRDGGSKWISVRKKLKNVPEGIWVSRIESSSHKEGRAYISFDGHRTDLNKPFLYVTENFGKSWKSIISNLPENEVIRVVREDPVNENLLYIGTETGVWASLDRGNSWFRLNNNMPTVSVYDLAIHPRDHALIAGSHGRGIFIMDDIQPLQQLSEEIINADFHLFDQPTATLWENVSRGGQRGHFWFAGENPDIIRPTSSIPRARFEVDVPIYFYIGGNDSASVKLSVNNGTQSFAKEMKVKNGINRFIWNREFDLTPYTSEEEKRIIDAFLAADTSQNFIKRRFVQFQEAGDTIEIKRRIIESIGEFIGLEPSLGIPKVWKGEYNITLELNGRIKEKELVIREDPLIKED